jgi:CRP/FNR family transcriptional regulator
MALNTAKSTPDDGDTSSHGPDPQSCEACEVRACGMCSSLSNGELDQLRRITRTREYKAGDQIFCDEEPLQNYAAIKQGIVKLSKILPDGRQQTLGLGFPPDFIGRTYGEENVCFASAVTNVTVCTFPKELFNDYLMRTPALEHKLFQLTLNELDAARDWMVMLGRMTALERTATMLLKFSSKRHLGVMDPPPIDGIVRFELPLTRSEISDFLGLTIETVSRQFTQLRHLGLIKIDQQRYIDILDYQGLMAVSGQE